MPLSGNSRIEKAIEERNATLVFIKDELPKHMKSSQSVTDFVNEIQEHIKTSCNTIMMLETGEEVKRVVIFKEQSNEVKYYFLQALWERILLEKNSVSERLVFHTGEELANFLNERGMQAGRLNMLNPALKNFQEALSIAKITNSPLMSAACLRNIANCQLESGKQAEAKASLQEAVNILNYCLSNDPNMPKNIRKEMQDSIREYTGYIRQL